MRPEDVRHVDWLTLPHGTSRRWIEVPSGRLAAAEWGPGSGTAVLALPGITGSKEDFALVGPLLARAGHRVVAVDLAGQYQSHRAGPRAGGRFDVALHLDDALTLLDGVGPAHVIGYSFAALVAEQLVVRRPALVRSVTLMSAPPLPGNALAAVRVVGTLARIASPRAAAALMIWGLRWNLNRVGATRYRLVRHRLRYTRRASVTDAMAAMMAVPDLEPDLRASGVPALVTAGRGDLWEASRHEAFARRIGAGCHIYDGGHSPLETTPHQVAADLLDFFASATGGPGPA